MSYNVPSDAYGRPNEVRDRHERISSPLTNDYNDFGRIRESHDHLDRGFGAERRSPEEFERETRFNGGFGDGNRRGFAALDRTDIGFGRNNEQPYRSDRPDGSFRLDLRNPRSFRSRT